jgi:hypothetical protein
MSKRNRQKNQPPPEARSHATPIDAAAADPIHAALQAVYGPALEREHAWRWTFTVKNGAVLNGHAERNEHWLELDVRLLFDEPSATSGKDDGLWPLLLCDTHPGVAARLVLDSERQLWLRSDIPLDAAGDWRNRIAWVAEGLKDHSSSLHGHACSRGGETREAPAGETKDVAPCDIPSLIKSGGWECSGSQNAFLVALDVPEDPHQAAVEELPGGIIRVSTRLGSWDPAALSAASRRALGFFLLRAAGVLRMLRATARAGSGQVVVGFETAFPASPAAADELGHALSALTLAWRRCGRETKALSREATANAYLEAQGLSVE